MKWNGNFYLFFLGLFVLISCSSKPEIQLPLSANYNIIPAPKSIDTLNGFFHLNADVRIYTAKACMNEVSEFQDFLKKSTGLKLSLSKNSETKNNISISLLEQDNSETYNLEVSQSEIKLTAHNRTGISRGLSTLKQLIELNKDSLNYFIPALKINDAPKFRHRGLLLDCSRHFFDKEVVKKYIDLLALYKMNVLHWHLTEDQGWRIAIDKYPKLTEVGAWRTELDGSQYGGFYTKDEIKELVAYAQEKHITIIPEIELPGHSQAAIASYPYLSCTGEQVDVANDWGVFKEIYCAGNDSVFIFLEDVLTEVMELFPSEYIHIGGDEAPKFRWEHCPKCQQRIQTESLKDEHALQSYFISRIEKFLNQNGRKLIGWDEILEGGLSENATLQSWRGMDGGITAASAGHDAIMSPTSHAYFDSDLKAIDLEKVYEFDPIPAELATDKQQYIIGGECNMWTEQVPDENNLDSKVFPRLLAMSEVLWSYPEERDYQKFYERVQHHYPILKNRNVNYGEETSPVSYFLKPANNGSFLSLTPNHPSIHLEYRFNCDDCDSTFIAYDKSIRINKTGILQIQPIKNNENYGNLIEIPFSHHAAVNAHIEYKTMYSDYYTAGGLEGLLDSKLGTTDFKDGSWQGFWGYDAEITLDLGELDLTIEDQAISEIAINFYQYSNSWIFFPANVEFAISRDGKNYKNVPTMPTENTETTQRGKLIATYRSVFERDHIRYIKIKAVNIKKVPDWHEAAGSKAWLFMDEIIVK